MDLYLPHTPADEKADPVQYGPNTAETLAVGLLSIYQPSLEKIKHQLDDLTKKQTYLTRQLEGENCKLSNAERRKELQEMHTKIEQYTTKLITVKKDMHQATEKMSQLKKRALWLQAAKQKQIVLMEQQREFQIQREQELIAKPVTKSNISPI